MIKMRTARDHLLWAQEHLRNIDKITEGDPIVMGADRVKKAARIVEVVLFSSS